MLHLYLEKQYKKNKLTMSSNSGFLSLGDPESYFQSDHIKTWQYAKDWHIQWSIFISAFSYSLPHLISEKISNNAEDRLHVLLFGLLCYEWQSKQSREAENTMERSQLCPMQPWASHFILSGHQLPVLSTALLAWFSHPLLILPVSEIRFYKLRTHVTKRKSTENEQEMSYLPFYKPR